MAGGDSVAKPARGDSCCSSSERGGKPTWCSFRAPLWSRSKFWVCCLQGTHEVTWDKEDQDNFTTPSVGRTRRKHDKDLVTIFVALHCRQSEGLGPVNSALPACIPIVSVRDYSTYTVFSTNETWITSFSRSLERTDSSCCFGWRYLHRRHKEKTCRNPQIRASTNASLQWQGEELVRHLLSTNFLRTRWTSFIQDARKENARNWNPIRKVLIWLRNAWTNWYIELFVHRKQNRR